MKHILIALSLVVGLVGCSSIKAQCVGLTGVSQIACEVSAFKDQVDLALNGDPLDLTKPGAIKIIDSIKPALDPVLAVKISAYEEKWPAIDATLSKAVASLNAGVAGDYQSAIAETVAFYVQLSALIVQGGGQPLPGLPKVSAS